MLAFFIQNLFEPEKQLYFGCVMVTVIISIVLHELAHGWAAIWQGDDTPRLQGHMTADPMVHMGGFSLLMLALMGIAFGAMPVNPRNFRSRYGDALVSAAGPAMNLLLAFIALTALAVWFKTTGGMAKTGTIHNAQEFLWIFGYFNIALALFNLVPVPPLDGSRILGNFVPAYGRWVDNLGSPMILFYIFFMVLLLVSQRIPQYHPFTIAAKAAKAYLSIFSSFLPG